MSSTPTTSSAYVRLACWAGSAAGALVLDQLTKFLAKTALTPGVAQPFIPAVMDLYLVNNRGAAFSLGEGLGLVYVLFALVVLVGTGIYVYKNASTSGAIALVLGAFAGGGAGNALDRILHGSVTDFLATTFIDFPIFNVADMCITVSCAVLLVLMWTKTRA